jgi:hypothetical protein
MNFLIIFMFLNASVLKNAQFSTFQNASAYSYLSSKLKLQNKWERYKYQTYQKKSKKPVDPSQKKEKKASKTVSSFHSHRKKEHNSSLGKWNLAPFLSADPYSSFFLGELTANLITVLYSHAPFWKEAEQKIPKLAEELVAEFSAKKAKIQTLSDLFPRSEPLQKVFYKMLQGSGSYDLESKEGYPPFEEFFTFSKRDKTLTSFPHASYPILKALFQDKVVETILSLEMGKWEKDHYLHSLTKEELRSTCKEGSLRVSAKRFQDIEPLLKFSHKTAALEKLSCKDDKTHVYLELPICKISN